MENEIIANAASSAPDVADDAARAIYATSGTRPDSSRTADDWRQSRKIFEGGDDRRLLVVDPRSLTRGCLVAALTGAPGIHSVTAVASIEEAARLADTELIDTALINMSADPFGDADLRTMIAALRTSGSPSAIILLTSLTDPKHASAAFAHGVQGFLSSDTPFETMIEAIRFVGRGWMIYPAFQFSNPLVEKIDGADRSASLDALTRRQRQVLHGLERGMTNRGIADALVVSERTIKAHVRELMRRLGANNRTQVVALMSRRDQLTEEGDKETK